MIFLTVGNATQSFNRLIKHFDEIIGSCQIDDGFIQRGKSSYVPKHCNYCDFMELNIYKAKILNAEIVVSHGGEGSIIYSLMSGKKPIVVPRLKKFKEHCNDHQLELVEELESQEKIYAVYDLAKLFPTIEKIRREGCYYNYQASNSKLKMEIKNYLSFLERKYK